jgi:NADH:ubiquinone oxidoreductase subunit 5 (subunit L)/multisubunit Na+/H+ antiporter MnhA subunit
LGSAAFCWSLSFQDATLVWVVLTVATLVLLFAAQYIGADPAYGLAVFWLCLFTLFMLVLVTAEHMLLLLVGWEGIGICSFALIGFWASRFSATKSALKAVLVNRLGDGLVLWLALWLCWSTGAVSPELIALSGSSYWLGLVAVLGSIGKSAQVGFACWLPDAMEGPTPVSALIHAATLVTAGVVLVGRIGAVCHEALLCVGAVTLAYAALLGLCQSDIKRVIAFSTCSQLGYMVASHGLGHSGLALAHLLCHALFKAALFLASGALIHAAVSWQDSRRFGGSSAAPSLFVLGSLSLAGLPFLSGFYTKDGILDVGWVASSPAAYWANALMLGVVCLTLSYSAKLIWSSFAAVAVSRCRT